MILLVGGVLVFFFSTAIQGVQIGVNDQLSSNNWLTVENWNSFNLANTFVNNVWSYFVVFIVVGVLIAGYVVAQKRGAGL